MIASLLLLLKTVGDPATNNLNKQDIEDLRRWRAVLKVGDGAPSTTAILENAHGLARYAQIAQAS